MKRYFLSKPTSTAAPIANSYHSGLRNKSTFNPLNKENKFLDVFKNMVVNDLEALKVKNVLDPQYIKRGIESLAKRKDIVIRPADKGGGLVVLSKKVKTIINLK